MSGTRRRPKPKKPGDGCWHCDEIARRAKYRASKNELMELDQVSHSHYTGDTIVYEAIKVDRDGPFHAMTREFYQGEGMLYRIQCDNTSVMSPFEWRDQEGVPTSERCPQCKWHAPPVEPRTKVLPLNRPASPYGRIHVYVGDTVEHTGDGSIGRVIDLDADHGDARVQWEGGEKHWVELNRIRLLSRMEEG